VPRANNRDAILDAAEVLIESEGVASLTTKSVARQARLSEAAIYYHFDDKFDLVLAVIARLPALQEVMRSLLGQAGTQTASANLERAASALASFWHRLLPALGPALADQAVTSRLRAFLSERHLGPKRGVEAITRYLEAEHALGRVAAAADASAIATAIMGACQAIVLEARLEGRSRRWVAREAAAITHALGAARLC
jgi:AcrR family transcriptional regulator